MQEGMCHDLDGEPPAVVCMVFLCVAQLPIVLEEAIASKRQILSREELVPKQVVQGVLGAQAVVLLLEVVR
eukprot:5263097-Heterocapsa_arctica.AAC.1